MNEIQITKPKIVIWGPDNYNTLGLIRSVANQDFDLLLLINGKCHKVASASKYCTKYVVTKSIAEGVKYLIDNYPQQSDPQKKAVLLPGGDSYSIGGTENYDKLSTRFHLMCTSDPSVLLRVTNKDEMAKEAEKAGILTPRTGKISKKNLSHDIPYPVILKHLHTEGRIEFKTKIIKSEEGLRNFSKIFNPNNTYLIQQFIPKEYDIYIYGCRLPNGKMMIAGYNNQYRWSDDGGGSFGELDAKLPKYIDCDALKRFFDVIDYHGLFSAEYGFYNNQAFFYEVNLRNDGFTHLALQAGANLPLLWVSACLNLDLNPSPVMTRHLISFNEVYDIINVLKGKISYRQYKNDKASAQAFNFYDPDDPQPYYNMKRKQWWEIPCRAIYKEIRPQIIWLLSKIKHLK